MSEEKSIRFSQALKEFNIAKDHAIEILSRIGFVLDKGPNTKLSADAYQLLEKEFSGDRKVREAADNLAKDKGRRENVVIDIKSKASGTGQRSESDEGDELDLKDVLDKIKEDSVKTPGKNVINTKEEKTEEPPPVEAPPTPPAQIEAVQELEVVKAKITKNEPKVLDKINLEEVTIPKKKSTKAKAEETAETKKETKGKGTKKSEVKVEPTIEPVKEEKAEEVNAPVTPIIETPAPEVPVEEKKEPGLIRATDRVEKALGPNIISRITPEELAKINAKPIGNVPPKKSDDKGLKKKRKRTGREASSSDTSFDKYRNTDQKPAGTGNTGTGGGPHHKPPFNKPQPGGKGRFDKNRKPETEKKEITSQEISEQLKRVQQAMRGKQSGADRRRREEKERVRAQQSEEVVIDKKIQVTEFVSADNLAKMMDVPVTKIISACMSLGMFVSINQRLDAETITVVAGEFGYEVEFVSAEVQEAIKEKEDSPDELKSRAPIVTVMGHVDHGKTSLLDHIRSANVIAGEAGGITQHIGAYEVTLESGKKICFLDTPGHEAFTAMRARGAKVTDVAIIVIAADDSVMPQTIEAINHASAAGVPIVFAINKIDKPGANSTKIYEQLSAMNYLVEEWGGKFQSQEISAKKGLNIDKLLDKVLLEAEMLELKANPSRNAKGTVIEATLDKGRGYVATMLVQTGTMQVGDVVLAGCHSGRIKAMYDERGHRLKSAGPSTPVMMLGLSGAPQAGDQFNIMDDEREAREIANRRAQLQREQGIRSHKHITLDEIGRRLAIGNFKELNLIVKGDVDGSVEALSDSLLKLSTGEIQVNVIHKSVGQISESDVLLASASEAIIVGFQVRPSPAARKLAETEEIDIRLYSVIYDAINEVKAAMEGLLAPEYEEKIICNIEIRETFKIPKVGTIAGCMVLDGKITRNTKVRIIRDGIVVFTGELASLKRFKDDVKEVSAGYECGLNIANFNDIKVGDIVEGYESVAVKRTL